MKDARTFCAELTDADLHVLRGAALPPGDNKIVTKRLVDARDGLMSCGRAAAERSLVFSACTGIPMFVPKWHVCGWGNFMALPAFPQEAAALIDDIVRACAAVENFEHKRWSFVVPYASAETPITKELLDKLDDRGIMVGYVVDACRDVVATMLPYADLIVVVAWDGKQKLDWISGKQRAVVADFEGRHYWWNCGMERLLRMES